MANRFGNFLQIADCYAWEKFPTLSEREFEKICEYVGTYGNNPYWGSLRSHGTVKTVQSLRQKL